MTTATPTQPAHDAAQREGFTSVHTFHAAPDAVFAALTSAAAISRWWAPCAGSGQAGGRLRLMFGDASVVLEVAVAEPARRVRWLVTASEPIPDWVGTSIDFALAPTGHRGTRLSFCHHGLTERLDCFDMCSAGWRQYLPSLVDFTDHDGGTAFGSDNDQRAAHWEQTRSGA